MKVIDASKLQQMVIGAYKYLEENKSLVDELNVFPVPDGDTGTNMNMTMKSGVDKVNQTSGLSVEEISKALSQGTLMGARGNSGVILSQLVRGMSKTLKGKDEIGASEVRDVFKNAAKTAYRAVMQPTEGTILTVARMMAEKAESVYDESKDLALDCPTLTLTKPLYLKMITGQIEGVKVLLSKDSKVKGNPLKIGKFFAMFKRPDSIFPIVTRPNG